MKNRKKYSRKSTSIIISIFYEHYQLKKYNLSPPYQRDSNVWTENQKSFLIDTIFKNFPIPPIFLEQKIDSKTGKTTFDVIDGKQRLTAIVDFIDNKIKLPKTFGNDEYGNSILNGKTFKEIIELSNEHEEIETFISDFWSYVVSVEYIEKPDVKVVDNIFDRLNREGTRLNKAELRKAQYYDTTLYNIISELRNNIFFSKLLSKLQKNRLQDVSFITEICIMIFTKKIIGGNEDAIDENFEKIVSKINNKKSTDLFNKVQKVESIVESFNLNYDEYKINGVSHLYAIFFIAFLMNEKDINVTEKIKTDLVTFFKDLRLDKKYEHVMEYHQSMQSASKYASSRKKRVKALLDFLEIEYDKQDL